MTDCIPLVQEFQKELSQWRKDPSGSKKKPKYSYKTVEELKAKGRISKKLTTPQKELSQVKVRGPLDTWSRMGRWKTETNSPHKSTESVTKHLLRSLGSFCLGSSHLIACSHSLHSHLRRVLCSYGVPGTLHGTGVVGQTVPFFLELRASD